MHGVDCPLRRRAKRFALVIVACAAVFPLAAGAQGPQDAPDGAAAGPLHIDPELEAINKKARELFSAGRLLEAVGPTEEFLERIRSRKRDELWHTIAMLNLRSLTVAIFNKGVEHYRAKNYPECVPMIEEAVRLIAKQRPAEDEQRKSAEKLLRRVYDDTMRAYFAYLGRVDKLRRDGHVEEAARVAATLTEYGQALRKHAPNMYGDALTKQAEVYLEAGRLREGLPFFKKAVDVFDATFDASADPSRSLLANRHHRLAEIYFALDEYGLAEQEHRHALELRQLAKRPNTWDIGLSLNRLGLVYLAQGRARDAEGFFKAALNNASEAKDISDLSHNLGLAYTNQGRLDDAERSFRRSLELDEGTYGPDHPEIAIILENLAAVVGRKGNVDEKEAYLRRGLSIREKAFGKDSPAATLSMHNLAFALLKQNRLDDARSLLERALKVRERAFERSHSLIAVSLGVLGHVEFRAEQWAKAYGYFMRASDIFIQNGLREGRSLRATGAALQKSQLDQAWNSILGQIVTGEQLQRLEPGRAEHIRDETFRAAQYSHVNVASMAVAEMSARHGTSDPRLTQLIRERQDRIVEWRLIDQNLTQATANSADPRAEAQQQLRSRKQALDARIAEIEAEIARVFPTYASYATPEALTIAQVQHLLHASEALIQYVHVPASAGYAESVFAWAVTREETHWRRIDLTGPTLAERVAVLRCGLDQTGEWDIVNDRWVARKDICRNLRPQGLARDEAPPFDTRSAHELHGLLLEAFGGLLRTADGTPRHLLVVPSGPLTQLPFHVLVTDPPKGNASGGAQYAGTAWLARRHAVTVLPSVGSLKGLRIDARPSRAQKAFLGFGNPLLRGDEARLSSSQKRFLAQRVRDSERKQACSQPAAPQAVSSGWRLPEFITSYFRGRLADPEKVRHLDPLPETADEICAIAKQLAPEPGVAYLGAHATESALKALNTQGALSDYRIVHFATHGLITTETESLANAFAEPALVLTPPAKATDEDDGLLTASEIAQLRIDADWVVLSACNSAAGGEQGSAETLSGLARAFFYAGSRALLVSHWYVDSHSAVKITTGAFAELRGNPRIGRSEALRRAMVAAMEDKSRPAHWTPAAHPSVWAPFVVVGEGGIAPQ
jgi:CHAT domain-containing protein/Tfp pilus assembly protein PilF